jgi:hypothetical protein
MASAPEWKTLNRSRHKNGRVNRLLLAGREGAEGQRPQGRWLFSAKGIAMAVQRKRTIKLFRIAIARFASR